MTQTEVVLETIALAGKHVRTAQIAQGEFANTEGAIASALIAIAMLLGAQSSDPVGFAIHANLET